jgi:hypothetical protein
MEQLHRQIARARRRLIFEQFLRCAIWSLFAALIIATIGLTVPKIWHVNVVAETWNAGWLGGAFAVSMLVAGAWTYATRRTTLDAAIEIDRRYGLRERVSSAISLQPRDLESEVGAALARDAARRVERIDVTEHFRVRASWLTALPVLPLAAALVLLLLPNVDAKKAAAVANSSKQVEIKKVKAQTRDIAKSFRETGDKLEEKGLKDGADLLRELEKAASELADKSVDRKKAMIKINEMAKKLEDRRQKMGGDQLKEKLEKLGDVKPGPAGKLAKAMKQGDFETAVEELTKLKEKIESGNLSDEEKEKLASQLEQIKSKMDQMKQAHEEAKESLKEQIRKKQEAGDNQAANDLQNKLDQMNQMNEQMSQMDQLAQKMGECSECMKQGDSAGASEQLSDMMQDMQNLQEQMDELETLNEALDELMASKDMMGDGMDSLSGMGQGGMGSGQGEGNGNGLGEGQGQGARPEERGDTGSYASKVASQIQKGQAVIAGKVDGPNVAGAAYETVKESVLRDAVRNSDALTDQKLPRDQRDHAREYFRRYQER